VRRHEVEAAAARELLACYEALAARRAHLLAGLLRGRRPVQWRHYPAEDALDRETGYQYFYHCHASGKRKGGPEHGHFHLFRRRAADRPPAHLLAIALTAKGVPRALFTVNQWVAGSPLPGARAAQRDLSRFEIRAAGDPLVNRWMAALLRLFRPEIARLLVERDRRLRAARGGRAALLDDRRVEVLSSLPIDVDARFEEMRL